MGYKLISFDKITSTQVYAHDLISKGLATDRTAILADCQTAGRGRYRRKWISQHGNLYISFIFYKPERDPKLSYLIAVAIAETMITTG